MIIRIVFQCKTNVSHVTTYIFLVRAILRSTIQRVPTVHTDNNMLQYFIIIKQMLFVYILQLND